MGSLARIVDRVTGEKDGRWFGPIHDACAVFDIDTTEQRVAYFLANCAYESSRFTMLREDLNYSAKRLLEVFATHFTAAEAGQYAGDAERIANRVYAGRLGNGDEDSGDGWRYRGGGLIELTGRSNYREAGAGIELSVDLEEMPELIVEPYIAAFSAAWFWWTRGLNELADTGDFAGCVRIVTGSSNAKLTGLAERQKLLATIEEVV
jgi:putative chitinase